jgi:hypothetical protein
MPVETPPGRFLVPLMEGCQQLTSAHVVSMPNLSWSACKLSSQGWGPKAITKLVVRSVGLDETFGMIIAKLGNLTELELDGPAVNIKAGALNWWVADCKMQLLGCCARNGLCLGHVTTTCFVSTATCAQPDAHARELPGGQEGRPRRGVDRAYRRQGAQAARAHRAQLRAHRHRAARDR